MKLRLGISGLLILALIQSGAQAGAIRRDLPTYEVDQPTDRFVRRNSTDIEDTAFRRGGLGVLLPTYDRESLFLAYRALSLGNDQLRQQEAAATPAAREPQPEKGIQTWLEARRRIADRSPAVEPEAYRDYGGGQIGAYLNCTNGAFALAAETLLALDQDRSFKKAEVQEWLAGQDAVFAQCSSKTDGQLALPRALDGKSSPRLRQLRQYQLAAAYFYAGRFDDALSHFDTVAADRKHPMRNWAVLGALRSILRKASLDNSLLQQLNDIKRSSAGEEQRRDLMANAWRSNEIRLEKAQADIVMRADAVLADRTLEKIHQPVAKLKVQATMMLTPALAYADLSDLLGRFDRDVAVSGDLGNWVRLGDKLFDWRGNLDLIRTLRAKHEYFDWIRTVQGCTDNPASPNFLGRCEEEHAYALQRWQASRRNTWLLAALLTASRHSPQLDDLLASAKQIDAEAMEFASVRYHLIRLLRLGGKLEEARALLSDTKINSAASVSAANLFAQEGLALARNEEDALSYLWRRYFYVDQGGNRKPPLVYGLPADADELLNRRMTSESLLALAGKRALPSDLRKQMLVAAWWRADLTENATLAQKAARQVAEAIPTLAEVVNTYLQARENGARHLVIARAALMYRLSPQIGQMPVRSFATRRTSPSGDWWCSFASEDFVEEARSQRIPAGFFSFSSSRQQIEAEMKVLNSLGTSADWLARTAAELYRTRPQDSALRPMLQAVVASTAMPCMTSDSDKLVAEAKQRLETLPAPPVISEEALRAEYARAVAALGDLEYRVFHILLKNENEAKEALAKLQAGTASFQDLARELSIDTGSRPKGGDLGWTSPSSFVGPFATAIRSMSEPGLVGQPVKTAFGWHLIRIDGIRKLQPPPFERVRSTLEERLRNRLSQGANPGSPQ